MINRYIFFSCLVFLSVSLNLLFHKQEPPLTPFARLSDLESKLAQSIPLPISEVTLYELEMLDGVSSHRAALIKKALPGLCSAENSSLISELTKIKGIGKVTAIVVAKELNWSDCPKLLQRPQETVQ